MWIADEEGNQKKVEVAKRIKRWWTASVDGKINLVARYGSKPLEFAKGKNAIELASEGDVAETLRKLLNGSRYTSIEKTCRVVSKLHITCTRTVDMVISS